jgi:hypothetical protein
LIRSTNKDLGEYDLIRVPEHVAKVWGAIEKALPEYWNKFIAAERKPESSDPVAALAAKFGKAAAPKTKAESECEILSRVFEQAIASYEKEAAKYRKFFQPDAIEEFHDDPNSFKQALARDVPVIANTLRQRRAELREWQAHFRMARAKDLLEVFSNVMDFGDDWCGAHAVADYEDFDAPEVFELDPLDDDEAMVMANVVGMGIKSIVLYHLHPDRLPARGRYGLYGLYFLSGREHFGLPSKSSEFLMVNDLSPASDGSIIMDQNYWYPYGLFSLYALRVFKWIEQRATKAGYSFDRSVRHVYVERFFESVCNQHIADLKTMRAHERFEVPA